MEARLGQLVGADAAVPADAADLSVYGLSADSRDVRKGFVFAALPGTSNDGARFIPQAVAAGAVAVIAMPGTQAPVPVLATDNPRRLLALMAARFFGRQPNTIVAVTGTNGKTSVAAFVREIWTAMKLPAASIGTVGVVSPAGTVELAHTTPDPVQLQSIVADLAGQGVDHLAIEASSHGLSQYRLDGLKLAAAAFTNITRDHLDYHPTFEDYFDAKMRLFEDLLPAGATAVINADSPQGAMVAERARRRGIKTFTVGKNGTGLRLLSADRHGLSQKLVVETSEGRHEVMLPLVGDFQSSNALVAAGLVIATGGGIAATLKSLEGLKGARGRLDLVAKSATGAPVFVDYAHTPDALENAILSLRPYVKGRLLTVFGCGGDRDRGKRPLMGAIASKLSDVAYVTDDNPRTEDAAAIRSEIMKAAPGAIEIGDRAEAIRAAVEALREGDVLLVAGKGHEEGQKIGSRVIPFSDHDAVRAAIRGELYHG